MRTPPVHQRPTTPAVLPLSLTPSSSYEELRAGFAGAVSHELRTPLARLLSVVESALLPEADIEKIVAYVQTEIASMAELIDDMLLISQLENPDLVVGSEGTRAAEVARDTAEQFADAARVADVTVRMDADPAARVPIRDSMFRAVVRNLVENSIRYAGPGATLHLSIREEDGLLEVVASDDGVGVTDEELPRLFERFYRADPSRHARGSGLGLAIVKHIAAASGGHVEADGAPNEGLTIRCTFPAPTNLAWRQGTNLP